MDHSAPWKEGIWLTDACRAIAVTSNPSLPNVPMAVRALQLNLFGEILQAGMHFNAFSASLHSGLVPMVEQAIVSYLSMCWATAGRLEDMVAVVTLPPPPVPGMAAAPRTKVLGIDPGVSVDDRRVMSHLQGLENVVAVIRLGADPDATADLMKEAGAPGPAGSCIRLNSHFVTTTLVGTARIEVQLRGTLHARTHLEPRELLPDAEEGIEDIYHYVRYEPLLNLGDFEDAEPDEPSGTPSLEDSSGNAGGPGDGPGGSGDLTTETSTDETSEPATSEASPDAGDGEQTSDPDPTTGDEAPATTDEAKS